MVPYYGYTLRVSHTKTDIILLRYHGRWIFMKNVKNLFFAIQIEKTEKNNLQKEWRKKLFYFLR